MEKFEVAIPNFFKHNGKSKKGFTHFMVSKRIFNDEKIVNLTPIQFQLYLYLLSIAADLCADKFLISSQMLPKQMRISNKSFSNHLTALQENQLLNAARVGGPYIIEKNRIEENRKEKKKSIKKEIVESKPQPPVSKFIGLYCERWRATYNSQSNPIITGKSAGQIKRFVGEVGESKALAMLEAYFAMPDKWFITKRHDISTFLGNLNAVISFMENGKLITSNELKTIEKKVDARNLEQSLEGDWLGLEAQERKLLR